MIEVIGENTPDFPSEFNRKLQAFDPDLWVTWHKSPIVKKAPGRWKIEQCVEHRGNFRLNGRPEHSHLCRRIYVTMVQDVEGSPMPLGDHVFEKLKAMRAQSDGFGGETERGLRNYREYTARVEEDLEAIREAQRKDIMRHNQRFNRITFNRLNNLRHHLETAPNR